VLGEKPARCPFFPTTNFTWAGLESNPGLCGEKPALNRFTFFFSRGKQAIVISRAGALPFTVCCFVNIFSELVICTCGTLRDLCLQLFSVISFFA
jgi:hypothetical protein